MRILVADDHEVIRRGIRALAGFRAGLRSLRRSRGRAGRRRKGPPASSRPDHHGRQHAKPEWFGSDARDPPQPSQHANPDSHPARFAGDDAPGVQCRRARVCGQVFGCARSAERGGGRSARRIVFRLGRRSPGSRSGPADAKTILEREAELEQALRESEERYRALATGHRPGRVALRRGGE